MARRYRRSAPSSTDLDHDVSEYLLNRSTRERATIHENRYKAQFMDLLAEVGEVQEGGHRILLLNEPLVFHSYKTDKVKEIEVTGIRRVRRETTALNPDRVMALLEAKNMVADCTVTRTEIDEDAVLAANFEGRITDEEMDSLWDKSENFAFYLVEE
jgi:hypothetical protein